MPSNVDNMRGLSVFITDIRNCKSREAEERRINKELANIRSKFKGDKSLDGYQKKKYICKLLFIFLLGHDVDFGIMEAVNLLSSNKYSEKQIGYLYLSVLMSSGHNLLSLVIQSLNNDLTSRVQVFSSLALQCIANIDSVEMVEAFKESIPKLLVNPSSSERVKQSSALCLLKLLQTSKFMSVGPPILSTYTLQIIHLLNDSDLGVVTASVSLLQTLARSNPQEYRSSISIATARLSNIITANHVDLSDYSYYMVPAPWLAIKLLQLLQCFPSSVLIEESGTKSRITECLDTILSKFSEPTKVKKVQHSNARNAVLFEAVNLIIHMDVDADLLRNAASILGKNVEHNETNMRCLTLECLSLLASSEHSHDTVCTEKDAVIQAIHTENDPIVRQKAADLLYSICDSTNVEEIVSEMLDYLNIATYAFREELVLKIAILAEKYAVDYTWYVDTILHLLKIAGDHVSEEVWYRVIQIVINQDNIQGYAVRNAFEALQAPACHENLVKVGGYLLGEFGNLIALDPSSSPHKQFQLLHCKYPFCSISTKQLLLSTYMKFVNLFPELKPAVTEVLENDKQIKSSNVELQQRSVEYLALSSIASKDVLATVMEEMPPFTISTPSTLAKLKAKKQPELTIASESFSEPTKVMVDEKFTTDEQQVSMSASCDLVDLNSNGKDTNGQRAASILTQSFVEDPWSELSRTNTDIANSQNSSQFIANNGGVIFEDHWLKITATTKFQQNTGEITLLYDNKTNFRLDQFSSFVINDPAYELSLTFNAGDLPEILNPNSSMQQLIRLQCSSIFETAPFISITYSCRNEVNRTKVELPIWLNKFMSGIVMNSQQFFLRWQNLSQVSSELVTIQKSALPLEHQKIMAKLEGFGFSVLPNVDPNPSNFVSAGIIHTYPPIGCLARLEPNYPSQTFRLTMRCNKDGVSRIMSSLLSAIL